MTRHKKPDAGATRRAIYLLSSITERHSNTLLNAAAVFLFAALGAAFGHAVDGMARDLTAGPVALGGNQVPTHELGGNQVPTYETAGTQGSTSPTVWKPSFHTAPDDRLRQVETKFPPVFTARSSGKSGNQVSTFEIGGPQGPTSPGGHADER